MIRNLLSNMNWTFKALVPALAVTLLIPFAASAQATRTMSAGVGEDNRVVDSGYSVRFEFAEVTGPYLANVNVLVKDAGGETMVDTVSEGPWLFADLPAGDYYVVATDQAGAKQGATFSVNGGDQRVIRLAWR